MENRDLAFLLVARRSLPILQLAEEGSCGRGEEGGDEVEGGGLSVGVAASGGNGGVEVGDGSWR
uniref:Uncharacterized protein n=1 Tax=Oryza sativa subsp. japonica TaxID=39947 RepID=Q69TP4_ORYSJ|nr:hypothetical protein [Oryza sativa Japonica Group]BAD35783.1 hypothetical protein [Oryza sativa Japonica Group]